MNIIALDANQFTEAAFVGLQKPSMSYPCFYLYICIAFIDLPPSTLIIFVHHFVLFFAHIPYLVVL